MPPEGRFPAPQTDGAPNILIVDDHVLTARALAKLLRGAGYATEIAYNGTDALARALACPPTAAMIDIHLPDLNGMVVSQKLRQQLGPDVPLIMLSGDTSMETINSLQHVGATYFLSKPINSSHLLELIQGWLRDAPHQQARNPNE